MKTATPRIAQSRLHQAFTLIEIVITLTIIAILASGSIYLLKGQIDSAKDTRVDSDLQAIGLALQSYESRALRKPTTEQGSEGAGGKAHHRTDS
jgi:general secretion pathway protein G